MGKRIMTSNFIYGEINYSRFISSMAEIYMKESERMAADDKA